MQLKTKLQTMKKRFKFRVLMRLNSASHTRIRKIFQTLLETDLPDFLEVRPKVFMSAYGNEVYVKDYRIPEEPYEFIMNDDVKGLIRVQEKLNFERTTKIHGVEVSTNWHEAYREDEHAGSLNFLDVLEYICRGEK